MRRLRLPFLVAVVVLFTACSGGDGGGSGGGSAGSGSGDGQANLEPFTNATLEVVPSGDSFNLTLRNYQSLTGAIAGINITTIEGSDNRTQFVSREDLRMNAGAFVLMGLTSGERYRFSVMVIYTNGSVVSTAIDFVWEDNRADIESGGILLGSNRDGDGRADNDSKEDDDDNDGIKDSEDSCPRGRVDWMGGGTNDTDGDGCRDRDEDNDLVGVTDLLGIVSLRQVELRWTNPAVAMDFINISWRDAGGDEAWLVVEQTNPVTSQLIGDLTNGETYTFKLVVHYANGGVSVATSRAILVEVDGDARLEVVPSGDSFNLTLRNYQSLTGAIAGINITTIEGSDNRTQFVSREDLRMNAGAFVLMGLTSGERYRFSVMVIYTNGSVVSTAIDFVREDNRADIESGGILLGSNWDGDGRADDDSKEDDDDNDGIKDSEDSCPRGRVDWMGGGTNDTDGDGCRDRDEDDHLVGVTDLRGIVSSQQVELRWTNPAVAMDFINISWRDAGGDEAWLVVEQANPVTSQLIGDLTDGETYTFKLVVHYANGGVSVATSRAILMEVDSDGDGVSDDNDNCPGVDNSDQLNTDGDDEGDACDMDDDGDGEMDAGDIDDDGDGLIEIGTAAELNMVRWVLDGSGLKTSETASLNTSGCGDGTNIMVCKGYELIGDISLSDYIAEMDPLSGWQPIAHDIDASNIICDGGAFSGIFDGNGFAVTGLFISRSQQDCVGLFGRVDGEIRRLGVVAEAVIGRRNIGGLVGYGNTAEIIQSYAVNGEVNGSLLIGGLVGSAEGVSIVQSYAVNGLVYGSSRIAGFLGRATQGTKVIQSYAVSDSMVSYESFELCECQILIGGLVSSLDVTVAVIDSYAVTGPIVRDSRSTTGGVVVSGTFTDLEQDIFWDVDTSGIPVFFHDEAGISGYNSSAIRSPTTYEGIYSVWADGVNVTGIDDNSTIWCDEDASGMIEAAEKRDASHAGGDNRIWDFGTADDYPALRCAAGSLADQRAWWRLNSEDKPALDRSRFNNWLDGLRP